MAFTHLQQLQAMTAGGDGSNGTAEQLPQGASGLHSRLAHHGHTRGLVCLFAETYAPLPAGNQGTI